MPRMFIWALLTVFLFCAALFAQETHPGSIFAVSLYKAHLMSLGGWGGYWLDRALFPYSRPHEYLIADDLEARRRFDIDEFKRGSAGHCSHASQECGAALVGEVAVTSSAYPSSMMRRAVIVAACLICVGLGA
jgi:Putative 2/3 transmembrane domain holin